jgi:hypothetical protein
MCICVSSLYHLWTICSIRDSSFSTGCWGGYQLLNIPAGTGIDSFQELHTSLGLDSRKLSYQPGPSIGDPRLICGWYLASIYRSGIDIDIALSGIKLI